MELDQHNYLLNLYIALTFMSIGRWTCPSELTHVRSCNTLGLLNILTSCIVSFENKLLTFKITQTKTVISPFPAAETKHLHNICTTSAQRLRRYRHVGATLCKCYTNVLCLLGCGDVGQMCSLQIQYIRVLLLKYLR